MLWEIRLWHLQLDGFFVHFSSILNRGEKVMIVMVSEEQQFHIYSAAEVGNQGVLHEVNTIPGVGYTASLSCSRMFVPQLPFDDSRIFVAGIVLDLVQCLELSCDPPGPKW